MTRNSSAASASPPARPTSAAACRGAEMEGRQPMMEDELDARACGGHGPPLPARPGRADHPPAARPGHVADRLGADARAGLVRRRRACRDSGVRRQAGRPPGGDGVRPAGQSGKYPPRLSRRRARLVRLVPLVRAARTAWLPARATDMVALATARGRGTPSAPSSCAARPSATCTSLPAAR